MKKIRLTLMKIAGASLLVCLFCLSCGDTNTAKTIVINVTGKVPIQFTWHDSRTDCPECHQTYATVNTTEKGDFNYGPYPFAFDGVTLNSVLSGYNRVITVWVTNSTGATIYRGQVTLPKVIADETADPVALELFPRGWYKITTSQPSANWEINDVSMTGAESGWMAGDDSSGDRGFIFRGLDNAWGLQLPALTYANWDLSGIDGGPSSTAWAVGYDETDALGLILRYDGAIWNNDVVEPVGLTNWRLNEVDFASDGTGLAVGESGNNPVVLQYSTGTWIVADIQPPNSISLYDVGALSGGDAVICGKKHDTDAAYVAAWDSSASTYTDLTPAACGGGAWYLDDVYAISGSDWWATGTCASGSGVVLRYDGSVHVETPTGPSGSWALHGIWANSSGEALAVGEDANGAVLLNRSGAGAWTTATPDNAQAGWRLNAVDFSTDGWGYAVGRDSGSNLGLVLKYPFPQ